MVANWLNTGWVEQPRAFATLRAFTAPTPSSRVRVRAASNIIPRVIFCLGGIVAEPPYISFVIYLIVYY